MSPDLDYGKGVEPISTFRQHYEYMLREKLFDNHFSSQVWTYPISSNTLLAVAYYFMCFFLVYDSYLQIAMNKPSRFTELISKLNKWERETDELEDEMDDGSVDGEQISEEILLKAKEAAEQRIRVMPAMRWRVFQRDGWKCVACGRSSEDDVILHIDHIVPRSKGGKDELDNYQTLCQLCNIGKGNKDETDLRKSKAAR